MSKNLIRSGISYAPGLSLGGLREIALNDPKNFMQKIDGLIENGTIKPADILANARGLFMNFSDVPVTVHMPDHHHQRISGPDRYGHH